MAHEVAGIAQALEVALDGVPAHSLIRRDIGNGYPATLSCHFEDGNR